MTLNITQKSVIEHIRQTAFPLENETEDWSPLLEAIGAAKIVLLGEATHGTSEFYTRRATLTKRLVQEKQFRFICVEGDWPSCYQVNQYIKGHPEAPNTIEELLKNFDRWPTWMWANEEMMPLIEWLRNYNSEKMDEEKVGFYGLDLYSLWESMESILAYLEKIGSRDIEKAKRALACFHPHDRSVQNYGVHASFFSEDCIEEVVDLLFTIQKNRNFYTKDREEALSLEMNARATVDAENFYRAMVAGGPESWNIRDRHMTDSLIELMRFHGVSAKAIVWEHNTHVGDARATSMTSDGEINVGQLIREHYKTDETFVVGFSTYQGTVIASLAWGDPYKIIDVPPASVDSWEALFHQASHADKMVLLKPDDLQFQLVKGHRAIGVVYEPRYEAFGNYVPTNLGKRYDAFVYLDHTHALHPMEIEKIIM